ncbi:luminal-binding protein 4-like [Phoenix dactylifera]|uniref:Luminal-binding protein 4-like n=1 Tax=Phoenix dactylifera TaxID=42345 RepID=A0A8B7BKX7_PHODC|nr:luminal-binding protein 4-like [Phoenix dactylifera]
MGNATGRAARRVFPPPTDVPPPPAGAGPSSSQGEDPVRFVRKFFDEFLGYLRKKFQERARGLHLRTPSPFWPFKDLPEPAPGTDRYEPVQDPVFLALLGYLIEITFKEGLGCPLSRGLVGLFLCALRGDDMGLEALSPVEEEDDPIIATKIWAVFGKLIYLGQKFREAGIKWKGVFGDGDDYIRPASFDDDGGSKKSLIAWLSNCIDIILFKNATGLDWGRLEVHGLIAFSYDSIGLKKKQRRTDFLNSLAGSSFGLTIGIDLGTSYTRAAADVNGSLEGILNDKGKGMTPSCVAYTEMLIGEDARKLAFVNPEGTILNAKRLIGRKFRDKDVQEDLKFVPYEIVNKDGKPYIKARKERGEWFISPEDTAALLLEKVKEDAERALDRPIMDAIVTVPAYFNVAQRRATKVACEKAHLYLVRIINEPTAASIAYGRYKQVGQKNILVCHIGGGTFDVSILIIHNGAFVVLATSGDKLGGEDFDKTIMQHFIKVISRKHRKDISRDSQALAKLRRECERAKRALGSQQEVQMVIESLCEGLDFSELLTRDLFEELNNDLFMKIVWHVNETMKDAGLNEDQIDDVVLTGGSSKIPKIRQLLRDYFNGKEPDMEVNPDEAARDGAAIIGDTLSGNGWGDTKDILILDVVPPTTGTGAMNTLIHRNIMIPTMESQIFTTYQDQQGTDFAQVFEEEDQGCLVARVVLGLPSKIASCVESLLQQSGPNTIASIIRELEAKLNLDLFHKAGFIRDQIYLLPGPHKAKLMAPGEDEGYAWLEVREKLDDFIVVGAKYGAR